MRAAASVLGLSLLLFASACDRESSATDTSSAATDRRVELQVGRHTVRVETPSGWQHLDHGGEQLFRYRHHVVGFSDLGPPAERDRERSLDWQVDRALADLDPGVRREIGSRDYRYVDDREIVVIESWDRLTHAQRRRFAFTAHEGALLVLYTRQGSFEFTRLAFDRLLETLGFDRGAEASNA